jgi:hypothetical protein
MHPFNSVKGAISTGRVLAVIVAVCLRVCAGSGTSLRAPHWPNRNTVLRLVPAKDNEKATARNDPGTASLINLVRSLPMLLRMSGHAYGLP